MAEYIEREKVLGTINYLQEICNTEVENPDELKIFNDVYEEIYAEVGSIETDDVRPERHGKWNELSLDDQDDGMYICSECKSIEFMPEECDIYAYCPNCGAKMDGKGGESDE